VGSRIRPAFTAPEFLRATGWLVRHHRDVYAIWGRRRVEPAFREELMVAVARVNSCRFCSYHHREWALREGLPMEELAALEGLDAEVFDARRWAAIAYASALAQSEFQSVPEPIKANFQALYDEGEQRDVETIARGMTWANRIGNTVDSLLARRRGEPLLGSRARDDYLVGGLGLVAAIPPALFVAVWRHESPLGVLRDFNAFSKGLEEELDRQ
jgi:AhpD family alkylhydroperoxidase